MRILTYTSLFPNSVQPEHGVFIYQRMAHLAKNPEMSVEAIVPVPYFPKWVKLDPEWNQLSGVPLFETFGGIRVHHPRYLLVPKISMAMHGALMFHGTRTLARKLMQENKFDLLDAHYAYPDGYAGVKISQELGIPAVVSARGTDMNLFSTLPKIRPKIEWTLRNAAGGIGVSSKLRDLMVGCGLPEQRSAFIGNGVDTARFYPENPIEMRKKLGLPLDRKVLISVAALKPHKGYPLLIPAMARLRKLGLDAVLYLIGRGEGEPEARRMIRESGVEDSIRLIGTVPNERLRDWYSAANASVLASTREGWPNVLLESMACGTPVVACNVGGVSDVLNSPDLGILTEPEVEAICTSICKVLNGNWDRNEIANCGRGRSWDAVAAEVQDFFSLVLQNV